MPFIVLLFGIVLVISGVRGNSTKLFDLISEEFKGQNNFGIWLFALFVIGALGYIKVLKPLSDAFLFLVVLVIVLANNKNGTGFFANLNQIIANPGNNSMLPTGPNMMGGIY